MAQEQETTSSQHETLMAMHARALRGYDALAARMQTINFGYLTANSIILASAGFVYQTNQFANLFRGLLLFYFGIIGVAICASWFLQTSAFVGLKVAKLCVTRDLESELGYGLVTKEKALVGSWDKLLQRYALMDRSILIPWVFIILQSLITIFGIVAIFCPEIWTEILKTAGEHQDK